MVFSGKSKFWLRYGLFISLFNLYLLIIHNILLLQLILELSGGIEIANLNQVF